MCLKVQSVHIWNSFIKDLEKMQFLAAHNRPPIFFPSGKMSSLNIFPRGKLVP